MSACVEEDRSALAALTAEKEAILSSADVRLSEYGLSPGALDRIARQNLERKRMSSYPRRDLV